MDIDLTGPTVVVIEDDPRSAELVELHLRAAGLRTVVASSGEQGLDLVRAEDPVAVVLDIHLPGMNGWEVLAALKGDPRDGSRAGGRGQRRARARPRLRPRGDGVPRQTRER